MPRTANQLYVMSCGHVRRGFTLPKCGSKVYCSVCKGLVIQQTDARKLK